MDKLNWLVPDNIQTTCIRIKTENQIETFLKSCISIFFKKIKIFLAKRTGFPKDFKKNLKCFIF